MTSEQLVRACVLFMYLGMVVTLPIWGPLALAHLIYDRLRS